MSRKFLFEKSMWQDQKKSSVYIYMWTLIGNLLGTVWIVGYAWQSAGWTPFFATIGVACMLAGAFLITGVFLGFLFGFPHTVPGNPSGVNAPLQPGDQAPTFRHEVNTNLEQISDWLTKILVGVSLTQVSSLPGWLKKYAKFAASGLGGYPNSEIFATGILIYYIFVGFLCGFLLTRLAIAGAIREADLEAGVVRVAQKVADVESKISEEVQQKKTDEETLSLVQVQLNASRGAALPSREDLNAKIQAASPAARSQVYFLAREARSQNRETNKPKMERTIPIFRALIASEGDQRDHNNHGQLGFALKDQEPPDCKEAERELSTAIEIRDSQHEPGALDYEFVRAFCRIKLETEALELEQPPIEETKRKILADLQKAIQDNTIHKRMQEDATIKQWLENNQDWLKARNVTLP